MLAPAGAPIQTRRRRFARRFVTSLGGAVRVRIRPTGGYARQPMRVLVVSNMKPDAGAPQRGSFVRDQVAGLRAAGLDVELLEFPPGRGEYPRAIRRVRRALRASSFDLVHAHYGLAGWCAALAGARPLVVTFHGTDVRHPLVGRLSRRLAARADLAATVSRELFEQRDGRRGLPPQPGRSAVLPCGADLDRFRAIPSAEARSELGLDPDGRYLLFAAAPARPEKRHDRAAEVARLADATLLTAGAIEPGRMALWLNAASAVLVTSDYEGFGLVAVEALACGRPVLSTPVGIAPLLLAGIDGCLAASFDAATWARLARAHLDVGDSRVEGVARAAWFGAPALAERVATAYREVLHGGGDLP
jgi:teichuronic acid biosynthesis glycosyltransferase TuaC